MPACSSGWRCSAVARTSISSGDFSSSSRGAGRMTNDRKALENLVLTRLMRLNATVQGVVTGTVTGLGIFIATNWLVIKGGPVVGPHLALLGQFFIGYRVTFVGSLLGFAYGFVLGFAVAYGVARMYNWLTDVRERRRQEH